MERRRPSGTGRTSAPVRRRLAPAAPHAAVCLLLGITAAAGAVATAWLIARLVAGAVTASPDDRALPALIAVLVARALLAAAREPVTARTAAAITTALRRRAMDRLLRDPAASASPAVDPERFDPYLTRYLPRLAQAAVVGCGALAALALTDPGLGMAAALAVPPAVLGAVLIGRPTAAADGRFADLVAGLPTLAAFGRAAEPPSGDDVRRRGGRTGRAAAAGALLLELAAGLAVAAVAAVAALRLADGALTGTVGLQHAVFALALAVEMYLPLRALAEAGGDRPPPARRSPDRPSAPAAGTLRPGRGAPSIVLARAVVAGPGRERAPQISLTVPAGTITVLTTRPGDDTAALMAAILGLRHLAAGTVHIDGNDLADLDHHALRRAAAWMPRRPVLIAGSVADNIRLAVGEGIDDAAVARAGADARAPDPCRRVPADGSGFGPGEAARIGLARVLLRVRLLDTPLLLLDEPTAHLDADTEPTVLASIEAAARGRTVLIASRRPAVLAIADQEVHW